LAKVSGTISPPEIGNLIVVGPIVQAAMGRRRQQRKRGRRFILERVTD